MANIALRCYHLFVANPAAAMKSQFASKWYDKKHFEHGSHPQVSRVRVLTRQQGRQRRILLRGPAGRRGWQGSQAERRMRQSVNSGAPHKVPADTQRGAHSSNWKALIVSMDEMDTTNPIKGFFQTTKRRLQLLDTTAITFTKSRATQSAASLAYYTFFSIFPLMLLFILGGSYFLDRQSVYLRVTQAVQSVLPISQQFIATNLQQVLKQRAAVGVFVLVSLLWSASNVFNNLAYDINMAWPEARARNFLQTRLIGLDMIAGLTGPPDPIHSSGKRLQLAGRERGWRII